MMTDELLATISIAASMISLPFRIMLPGRISAGVNQLSIHDVTGPENDNNVRVCITSSMVQAVPMLLIARASCCENSWRGVNLSSFLLSGLKSCLPALNFQAFIQDFFLGGKNFFLPAEERVWLLGHTLT